jgi:hypothetical protein
VNKEIALGVRGRTLENRYSPEKPSLNTTMNGRHALLNAAAPQPSFLGGGLPGARFHRADDGFVTMRPSQTRRGFE